MHNFSKFMSWLVRFQNRAVFGSPLPLFVIFWFVWWIDFDLSSYTNTKTHLLAYLLVTSLWAKSWIIAKKKKTKKMKNRCLLERSWKSVILFTIPRKSQATRHKTYTTHDTEIKYHENSRIIYFTNRQRPEWSAAACCCKWPIVVWIFSKTGRLNT